MLEVVHEVSHVFAFCMALHRLKYLRAAMLLSKSMFVQSNTDATNLEPFFEMCSGVKIIMRTQELIISLLLPTWPSLSKVTDYTHVHS